MVNETQKLHFPTAPEHKGVIHVLEPIASSTKIPLPPFQTSSYKICSVAERISQVSYQPVLEGPVLLKVCDTKHMLEQSWNLLRE